MTKYAVVKIGGSQYKVAEGDLFKVEKLDLDEGKLIEFNEILLLVDGKKLKIGQPLVKGVKVKAKIIKQFKDKKIRVATYKAKSRYRKVKGHRKHLTEIEIEKITVSGK